MGLVDRAVAEVESFLLLSKYVKQLLIKLSYLCGDANPVSHANILFIL